MAAIDKIYGSQDDWYEFYNWLKNNKASYIKYLYPEEGYEFDDRPISNFPEECDMWLLKNCPLDWVVGRIKVQYGMDE